MARAILKRSKVLLMDEVRGFTVLCGLDGPDQLFNVRRLPLASIMLRTS